MIWIVFFDQNNWIEQFKSMRNLGKMQDDIEYYTEKIKADSIKTHELFSDNENLEKFAREEYLMKRDNEDVFVIVEE